MVHTYTHNLKSTGVCGRSAYRTTALLLGKHSLCGLQLYERSDWRAMAPHTHHGCSLIQHYRAYITSPCIHRYFVCNYTWHKTYVANDCITQQKTTLPPTRHRCISSNYTSFFMHVAASFQIQCTLNACTLIIIVANTHALVQCNEFAAKQQKEHKRREKRFAEPFFTPSKELTKVEVWSL